MTKPWYKQRTTWSAIFLLVNQLAKLWFPEQEKALQSIDLILGAATIVFLRSAVEANGPVR